MPFYRNIAIYGRETVTLNKLKKHKTMNRNPYRLSDDTRYYFIQIPGGIEFMVDAADFHLVSQYHWTYGKRGYPSAKINRQNVTLHKLLFPNTRGLDIDHISGNKLDNRRANLRLCTHQENMFNQRIRTTNSSGYTGVSYHKSAKSYEAYINFCGRKRYLGLYHSAEEAAMARDHAALEVHGEYARLNFPKESGSAYG